MSLYWHVGSKEELLDLMLESIEAEIEVPEPSGDWRADLGAFAHRTRAAMSRHRWAMEFIGSRPPSGPNDARNLERLLGLLDGRDDIPGCGPFIGSIRSPHVHPDILQLQALAWERVTVG